MGDYHVNMLKVLEDSPKGRLQYDTGWDERPNAVNALISTVQEVEVDKPNRVIIENAIKVVQMKERYSLSPKTSPHSSLPPQPRARHSLPGNNTAKSPTSTGVSSSLLSSVINLKAEQIKKKAGQHPHSRLVHRVEPRIEIHQVDWDHVRSQRKMLYDIDSSILGGGASTPKLLTPPRILRRKKSVDGSPIFKPSPTFSSSTQTQTHSSTTSDDATTATPTKTPASRVKTKKLGINDEDINELKFEEDLMLESQSSPYDYIIQAQHEYEENKNREVVEAARLRLEQFALVVQESERKVSEIMTVHLKEQKQMTEALKQSWIELDKKNLEEVQQRQQSRLKLEEQLQLERQAAADAAEAGRQAVQKAALEEQLRVLKEVEDQRRKEQEAIIEEERQRKLKADEEEKRRAEEEAQKAAAAAEQTRPAEAQSSEGVVEGGLIPALQGTILKDDLIKYAKTDELLKQFDSSVSNIDGRDPTTKAFYVGAVKSINTPFNALADTNDAEILNKVQHFKKLLSGEAVSGGGSMDTLFQCTSVPNGLIFVMKTSAFRFVKKSEADVTRGKTTVQPLATVGVHLCKLYPDWASLVQANLYKLCPFLVPFNVPQGGKSIQEYAKGFGHDLSGPETAIQQTFLERLKGYCTLYALMVLKFHQLGPFEIGFSTDFFTLGGAWQILSHTMKLVPLVDVTATVIHTILEILDDTLYAVYKVQFSKLMRFLILQYLPKIKSVTPPAKSGSLSRFQTYLEKKFAV